jgi:hypothetical protein
MEVQVSTVEGLAWCSGFHSSSMKVGAIAQVKFRVLLKALFSEQGLSSG